MSISFSVSRQADGSFSTIGEHTNHVRQNLEATSQGVNSSLAKIANAFKTAIEALELGQTVTLIVDISHNPPK